jgi:formamidopyrimidine-DNA glycosylase
MPELPEVQTTVNGLNRTVKGRKITAVTTTYKSAYHTGKDNIKDPKYFKKFSEAVIGEKILKAERIAKNVLIHLSGDKTILIHMKMTGHIVYDRPDYTHIRLDLTLDNGKHLCLSDLRRFAKVTLIDTEKLRESIHLSNIGPDPLEKDFTLEVFKNRIIKKPKSKIKTVLMDQSLIAGIGNIYSDEILWRGDVHPLSRAGKIPQKNLEKMFKATKEVLKKGIDFGGDSMSDYRNIHGERGKFQDHHQAYRKKGKKCGKKNCKGIIERMVVGTRSAHFCPKHQTPYG